MTTLVDTMARYRAAQEFMQIDPETYSWQTKAGMMIKRRQIEQEIVALRQEARDALQQANGAVCFLGPAQEMLAKARKKGPTVAVDVAAVYRDIARNVEKTIYPSNREWTTEQTSVVGSEIMSRMADINPYDRPEISPPDDLRPFIVGMGEDLVAVVRKIVRRIYGDRLAGETMARQLLDGALEHDLGKGVPQLIAYGAGSQAEAECLKAFWPFAAIVDPKQLSKK